METLSAAKIRFRQPANAVSVPVKLMSRAFQFGGIFSDDSRAVSGETLAVDLAGSLRQYIRWRIPDGTPDVVEAADAAGLSVRSLQRELSAEGLNFSALLDSARFELAQAGLKQFGARVIDVALDVSFSDHGNFTRAFRRWTGVSPREWRTLHADS